MLTDLNKIRRYELKYIIDPETAAAIQRWIAPVFRRDEHVPAGESGYTVNNLYFDTPTRRFYLETKQKAIRRFKLRVRYYSQRPGRVLMLEVKNKDNGIVWKHRSRLPTTKWPHALDDWQTFDKKGSHIDDDTFLAKQALCQAEPMLHVRYFREPFVSEIDPYGRITFDRRLRFCMANGSYRLGQDDREMSYYDDAVTSMSTCDPIVLEIKTEVFLPSWASRLIRRFQLNQRGFSKYCYALDCQQHVPLPRRSVWFH